MFTAKSRRWAGRFNASSPACDLVFLNDVDNGVDNDPQVNETPFQLRVEEGELPGSKECVLILSVLFPGGEIHHRGFSAEEARRIAADLLESASLVDSHNRERNVESPRLTVAA
jgi:hypothetical protein